MDFNLSQEHQLLSDSLRRFFSDTYPIETRNAEAYSAPYHSPKLWSELVELGVVGAFVTEEQGGFGGSAEDVIAVFEEVGRALCAEPLLGTLLGARLLALSGKFELVESIVNGDARAAVAVFEPTAVCDLMAVCAEARQSGDSWLLSGRKSAVYGAPGAKHVLIVARTGDDIGLFLAANPPLISAAMIDGGGVADIVMDDLPAQLLSNDAQSIVEDALDLGRIALCAEAVGVMDYINAATVDYLGQREQFGRPIASFQALRHRVVDMVMELEQCRSIAIRAAASFGSPDQSRHVSMAKNLIGRVGEKIAEEAIQLHGGIGMTWEYPVSHYAKRLVMIDHQLGDKFDHALRLTKLARGAA